MKLVAVFLLAACLQVSARGYTQKVTLNLKDVTLEKVFREIKRQSGYLFLYNVEELKRVGKVSVNVKDADVDVALSESLSSTGFTFKIVDKTIVLNPRPEITPQAGLFTPPPPAIVVRGRVTDENGNGIPSVSVVIPGTPLGAMTNERGEYTISNAPENAKLLFSYVGYFSQTVNINGRSVINIVLKLEPKQLDEMVVIAYGTTTKRLNTGSVSSITSGDIAKQPVANPLAVLPGRISGTLVAQNNGLPGSAVQIQIRGQNSLSQGGIPLYVIDGVPFTNFNGGIPATDNLNAFGTSGANGAVSPFGLINPSDIDRIDILKDADATAIYGSRAANGVVLITTKKGRSGKTKLDINVSTGSTEVNHFIPMLDLSQYLQLRREAFKNDNVVPTAANAPDLMVWDTTKSTDWQKMFLGGTGHVVDAGATLSGGDARTRFFFNSSYRRETTIFPGDDEAQRFATRLNVEHSTLDKKFNVAVGASYSNDNTNLLTSDLASVYNLPPNLPLYNPDGSLFWNASFTNPLGNLLRKYKGVTTNLIGNATLRYTVLPGLNLKANFGYTTSDLDQRTATPASSQNPVNNPTSSAVFADNKAQNWIIEPTAEYTRSLWQGKLSLLAGGSWQHNTSKGYFFNGNNYSSEALLGTLTAAGTVTVSYNNVVEYKYAAFFGRLNYNWKEKYFLNATFRRDGSSRFGPANRFGTFGAVGAAWIFSEESFMKNLSFLSYGKLRGSYGTTGNDQISNYTYLSLYGSTTVYLNNPTLRSLVLKNENIQWETTKKLEVALELGFLKDRILLTTNYYRNRSGNQITFLAVPTQSGFNSLSANLPAVIQNSGLEIELNTTNVRSKTLKWTTSLNITLPRNKLVSFPGLENTFSASSYIVGQPIGFTRVYHYLGVDPATGKATYDDIDKDGTITSNDRYIGKIGTPYYGGLGNSISYKNFQLDVFFQFNHRFGTNYIFTSPIGTLRNQNTAVLDRWRQAGDITRFPGATTTAGTAINASYSQFSSSDAVYGNASYVKLRSANLSYTLPANWTNRIKMTNCRIFVEGQNLYTWAKNKYIYDTETQVQGGPSGLGTGTIGQLVPPLRTIVFGINCSF